MQLFNLKDHTESASFTKAVLQGIGRGQGLFFPDRIEPFDEKEIEDLLALPLVPRSQRTSMMRRSDSASLICNSPYQNGFSFNTILLQ